MPQVQFNYVQCWFLAIGAGMILNLAYMIIKHGELDSG